MEDVGQLRPITTKPRALRTLRRSPAVWFALGYLLMTLGGAVGASRLTPHSPMRIDHHQRLQPPSRRHPLGTDDLGRDVLARLLHGGRISLGVGALSVTLAVAVGVPLGALAGYFGRWVDTVVMRGVEIMMALPSILLAIVILAALGPGLSNVVIAVGIVNVPLFVRQTRAAVLAVKQLDFVEAGRALGASHGSILVRHILPNASGTILVLATLGIGTAILDAAGLSFLGLGPEPATPDWGNMLQRGHSFVRDAPWIVLAPGSAIALTVLSFNLLGDVLRDALDPRTRA